LEILPDGAVQLNKGTDVSEAAEAAVEQQDRRKEMKAQRIRQMQQYADLSACRREHLLRYFGDDFTGPCNNCDNCEARLTAESGGIQVDPHVGTRREVA
jgi:ATP-dependent DNA helicase RecQ